MYRRIALIVTGMALIGIGFAYAQEGPTSTLPPQQTETPVSESQTTPPPRPEQTSDQAPSDLPTIGGDLLEQSSVLPSSDKDDKPKNVSLEPKEFWEKVWDLELFQLGSNPVKLSQLVTSLMLLLLGVGLSRWATKLMARHFRKRSSINPNAIAMFQRVMFYLFTAIVILIAMEAAGIPISSLAFLGGALAIGMGLGAQNLLNNFLSGMVMMLEQPIRVGDLILVADNLGVVEEVGSRSTKIRRTDGIDVLVPNSTLLESNVINWTLTDDRVRTSVIVGVAYGSPTEQVRDLILEAVNENQRIIHSPAKPLVIFDDFGNNSLNFEVFFWTTARTDMQLRTLRSEVRFRIDALFREAGIVIAFPQRDVHLDTLSPLQVEVVSQSQANDG